MKREDKVISLGLAKQIDVEHKRLGIEVESEFVWFDVKFPNKPNEVLLCRHNKIDCTDDFISFESWQAYDTAELGEVIARAGWDYCEAIYYVIELKQWQYRGVRYYSEAEAKGQKYLYLLKNGHIKGGSDE